jgi:hypothetical protein
MKPTAACLATLLGLTLAPTIAIAQYYYPAQPSYSFTTCPGAYVAYANSPDWYPPSYNVNPPFPPYSGIPPWAMQNQSCAPNNANWMRSPRDFFMWTEAQRQTITRAPRAPFLP